MYVFKKENQYWAKNSLSIVFYIKPTFVMYFSQILQGQFSGFHVLIAFLNFCKISQMFDPNSERVSVPWCIGFTRVRKTWGLPYIIGIFISYFKNFVHIGRWKVITDLIHFSGQDLHVSFRNRDRIILYK